MGLKYGAIGSQNSAGRVKGRAWRIVIFLALAVLALGQGGCALQQKKPHAASQAPGKEMAMTQSSNGTSSGTEGAPASARQKELYSKVKQPKGPLEVLANLKYVLKHDLLLREDFFTAENMERFFGAELPIKLYGPDGKSKVSVLGRHRGYLDHIDPPNKKGSSGPAKRLQSSQFGGGLRLTDQGKKRGVIALSFIDGRGPTLDDVEQVFGKDWILDRRPIPRPGIGFDTPEYWKVQRKTIFYKFSDTNIMRVIRVYFENGSAKKFTLTIKVR